MARTIKQNEHPARRGEILDAALHLVVTKGYERMTIGDILDALKMSSGALYHYFGSKPAVLDALVLRIREQSAPAFAELVEDAALSAVQKLQGFFDLLERLRREQQTTVIELLRVWYADHNAIVRQKVEAAVRSLHATVLGTIAGQGICEGVFAPASPEHTGNVVATLAAGMSNDHAAAMLAFDAHRDESRLASQVVATHTAYVSAIERVLGAPAGTLRRITAADVHAWAEAIERKT
jgi:AcrR family transcriptional regulator